MPFGTRRALNGGSASEGVPSFAFDGQTTIVPIRSDGSGTPTFTRASVATVLGYGPTAVLGVDNPIQIAVASGEARFVGARRISEGVWSSFDANGVFLSTSNGASSSCCDARGPYGYLSEGAATQLVTPTASIRDMTDASWVAGATMTVAKNAVGADGTANGASTLTGGAVEATNTILQTLVAAASSRTYSALVRLVSGTGPVYLMQGATASADLFSSLNTSTYTLLELNASVLNVAFGFKLGVNTVIEVDMNQFEARASSTSRILTAGATRAGDLLTFVSANNIDNTVGSAAAEVRVTYNNVATANSSAVIGASNNAQNVLFLYDGAPTTLITAGVYDGAPPLVETANTAVAGTMMNMASAWGGTTKSVVLNGGSVASGSFNGSMNIPANFVIGNSPNGTTNPLDGTIRFVRVWMAKKTDAQLAQMTT